MELIRGHYNLRARHRGCVATIGNFDGVHLGHQAVLGQLSEKAAELRLPSVVVTFEPHPQEYFGREQAPPRLTRFREKIQTLRRYAVDRVLVLPFNRRLAGYASLDYQYSHYQGDDPLFLKRRRDHYAALNLGASYHLVGHFRLLPELRYTWNYSTLPLNRFDRLEAMLTVRNDF